MVDYLCRYQTRKSREKERDFPLINIGWDRRGETVTYDKDFLLGEMASGLLLPYLDGTRWHSDGTAEWFPRPALDGT